MMHSRPPTGSSYDNDERHVILFRPISEAACCWYYDNNRLINVIPSFNHILDALLPTLTREASGTFLTNSGQQSVVFCATCSLQAVLQHARVPRYAVHTLGGRAVCQLVLSHTCYHNQQHTQQSNTAEINTVSSPADDTPVVHQKPRSHLKYHISRSCNLLIKKKVKAC